MSSRIAATPAMADPANVLAVDDIAMLTRLDVKPAVADALTRPRLAVRGRRGAVRHVECRAVWRSLARSRAADTGGPAESSRSSPTGTSSTSM